MPQFPRQIPFLSTTGDGAHLSTTPREAIHGPTLSPDQAEAYDLNKALRQHSRDRRVLLATLLLTAAQFLLVALLRACESRLAHLPTDRFTSTFFVLVAAVHHLTVDYTRSLNQHDRLQNVFVTLAACAGIGMGWPPVQLEGGERVLTSSFAGGLSVGLGGSALLHK